MNNDMKLLRDKAADLTRQLEQVNRTINSNEQACRHNWPKEPTYDPIYKPGYHIPGDPPGVGGSDHQFPMDVPAETKDRWMRTCLNCGKVEVTTRSEQPLAPKRPVF